MVFDLTSTMAQIRNTIEDNVINHHMWHYSKYVLRHFNHRNQGDQRLLTMQNPNLIIHSDNLWSLYGHVTIGAVLRYNLTIVSFFSASGPIHRIYIARSSDEFPMPHLIYDNVYIPSQDVMSVTEKMQQTEDIVIDDTMRYIENRIRYDA